MTEGGVHRERPARPDPAPVHYEPEPEPAPSGPVRVETRGSTLLAPRDAARRGLRQDGVPAALVAKDPSLWGPDAAAEAAVRLGWLDLPVAARELLPQLADLRAELRRDGLTRVVLCGMGGSSLAPEVICATYGAELVVLDSTDPLQAGRVLDEAVLRRSVFVVSSKSGTTIETDSQLRVLLGALRAAGLTDAEAWQHVVVVTDPGSPLAELAEKGHARRLFLADPHVGGRYSALSAFGLVPSALAGVDVARLLDDAAAVLPDLGADQGNPGLDLGAALGGLGLAGRDKVVLVDADSGLTGFADWAEQLVAESTGKLGTGLLPVVVEGPGAPGTKSTVTGDLHVVRLGATGADATGVTGPLGGCFLVWEFATALAGRLLKVNPFDQPNVAESKANTERLLAEAEAGALPTGTPVLAGDGIEVYGDADLLGSARSPAEAVAALLAAVPARGYLAVTAYLDRYGDAAAAELRRRLAARTARPVTFGWAPRFLHSTGQYHKGGPQTGAFLQLTGAYPSAADLDVPGRPFSLGRLQLAQALGDARALRDRGRPVVRLHLSDRVAGLAALLDAFPEEPE